MYRAHFSFPDTDPFSGKYQEVLEPYHIDPMNAEVVQTPASVSQKIYAASQQWYPTNFLLWDTMPGLSEDRDTGRVSLLHSISHYTSRMVRPASQWDERIFANHVDVSYGTVPLAAWDPTYLHLAPAVYVPSAATIDTSLDGDPNVTLLGPYGAVDVGAKIIHFCKTVYVPVPYVGLLLSDDLTPVEAWNRLRGDIVDPTSKTDCRPIIDWLRATIVLCGPNTYSALMVPDPLAPLPNSLLLHHRHQLLMSHLHVLKPSINHVTGTCIAETVIEVAVELRETQLDNKWVRDKK